MRVPQGAIALSLLTCASVAAQPPTDPSREAAFVRAEANGVQVEDVFRRTRRMMHAWLAYADERTLLLPDVLPDRKRGPEPLHFYRPHNSGADNYPYLVATAWFTDRPVFDGRLREMLRNEIRYTNAKDGIPADLDFEKATLGPPSLFGAAEYAKDGLLAITELLGRTPWFYRMADMTADLMKHAPVASDFGALPDAGAELNGDVLQSLVRLSTDDRGCRATWSGRAGSATPTCARSCRGTTACPATAGTSRSTKGPTACACATTATRSSSASSCSTRSRPSAAGSAATSYRQPLWHRCSTASWPRPIPTACSTTRSAPPTSRPLSKRLSDNWGYVYGAVYTHYMVTGDERYREAVQARAAQPAALPGPRLGERQPRRLRRRDRERPLPGGARAGAGGASTGSRARRSD